MARLVAMTSPARTAYANAGFSLLEVMIVIALLAIAVSFALPNFSRLLARQDERSAESVVRARIVQLRALSFRMATPIYVKTDTDLVEASAPDSLGAEITLVRAFDIFPDGTCSVGIVHVQTSRGYDASCSIAKGRCVIACSDGRVQPP